MDPLVAEVKNEQSVALGNDDSRFYFDLQDIEDLDQSFEETLNEMELKSGHNATTFLQKEGNSQMNRMHLSTSLSSISLSNTTIIEMLHLDSTECQLGSSSCEQQVHENRELETQSEPVVQGGSCSDLPVKPDLESLQIKPIFEASQTFNAHNNVSTCCPTDVGASSSQYYIQPISHIQAVLQSSMAFPPPSSPMPQLAPSLRLPFMFKPESCMDSKAHVKLNHKQLEHCRIVEDTQRNGSLLPSTSSRVMKTNGQLDSMRWRPAAKTRTVRKPRVTRNRFVATKKTHIEASTACTIWSIPSSDHLISWGTERACMESPSKVSFSESSVRFLLQKELKPSDVGSLGRIVLPKKEAEANLPHLFAREGMTIPMEDIVSFCIWNLKFRFWPNNKSRMYLLENTRDFVKTHHLQEGDFVILYKDDNSGKYVIKAKRVAQIEKSYTFQAATSQKTNLLERKQGGLRNVLKGQVNPDWVNTNIEHGLQVPLLQDFVQGQSGLQTRKTEAT